MINIILNHKRTCNVIETNNKLLHDHASALEWLVRYQAEIKSDYLKLGMSLQVYSQTAPTEVIGALTQNVSFKFDDTVKGTIQDLKSGMNTWLLNMERELTEFRKRLHEEFPEDFAEKSPL